MVQLRIEEAYLSKKRQLKQEGRKFTKTEFAKKLWPGKDDHKIQNNFSNLITGQTRFINIDWVKTIYKETGFTPNDLFGFEDWKYEKK